MSNGRDTNSDSPSVELEYRYQLSQVRHAGQPEECVAALDKVGNLAKLPKNKVLLCKHGAIVVIRNAMADRADDAGVAAAALNAIRAVSDCPEARVQASRDGAIPAVVGALDKFPSEPAVVASACRAVTAIGEHDGNKILIARSGAIDRIVSAMTRMQDEVEVVAAAAEALHTLAKFIDNARMVADQGGIDSTLAAMRKWPDQPTLQARCIGALMIFARVPEHREHIVQSEGAELVISAMRKFPADTFVQAQGNGALANFCVQHIPEGDEEGSSDTQSNADRAISRASNTDGQFEHASRLLETIGHRGGIIAVLNNMRRALERNIRSPDVELLLTAGCSALWNFCKLPANQIRILRENGLDVIVPCILDYTHNPELAIRATGALYVLTDRPEVRKDTYDREVLPALMVILQQHGDRPDVITRVYALMARLGRLTEARLAITERVFPHISDSFHRFPEHISIFTHGVELLTEMCMDNGNQAATVKTPTQEVAAGTGGEIAKRIRKENVLQNIIFIMKRFPTEEELLSQCFRFMAILTQMDVLSRLYISAYADGELIDLIIDGLQRWSSNVAVISAGLRALSSLCTPSSLSQLNAVEKAQRAEQERRGAADDPDPTLQTLLQHSSRQGFATSYYSNIEKVVQSGVIDNFVYKWMRKFAEHSDLVTAANELVWKCTHKEALSPTRL